MSRFLFAALLGLVGLLYLWLAFQSVLTGLQNHPYGQSDWVQYLGAVLFLAAGVGAALAGVNLVRAKRR